jgi:hypothetical protein
MARASGSSAMLTTNSPVRWMFASVSFSSPLGRRFTAITHSGGSSQSTLKKLNGAALTTPVGPTDVTHAIGRGSTKEVSTL